MFNILKVRISLSKKNHIIIDYNENMFKLFSLFYIQDYLVQLDILAVKNNVNVA